MVADEGGEEVGEEVDVLLHVELIRLQAHVPIVVQMAVVPILAVSQVSRASCSLTAPAAGVPVGG